MSKAVPSREHNRRLQRSIYRRPAKDLSPDGRRRSRTKTRSSSISESLSAGLPSPEKIHGWDQDCKDLTRTDLQQIPIQCSICQEIHPLYLLYYHKLQHRARSILCFKEMTQPTDMKTLAFQRQKVISNLIKSANYSVREKQKIDSSYELLKETIMSSGRYNKGEDIENIGDSPVLMTEVRNQFIKAIAICQDQNCAWRTRVVDDFVVIDSYGDRPNTCFMSLFDGFHGAAAAKIAAAKLPVFILDHISKVDPTYKMSEDEKQIVTIFERYSLLKVLEIEQIFSSAVHMKEKLKNRDFQNIHTSFAKAFLRVDQLLKLGRKDACRGRWSGCTAVTCLIEGDSNINCSTENQKALVMQNKHGSQPFQEATSNKPWVLHVANLGDIHVVLCRSGQSYRLTKDHSTSNARERSRVHQAGGTISTNMQMGLVEGITRFTRGFGCHGNPKLKRSVISVPYTVSIPIDPFCQFLVLASSGLWEAINENEVVAIAQKVLLSFLRCHRMSQLRTHTQMRHALLLRNTTAAESSGKAGGVRQKTPHGNTDPKTATQNHTANEPNVLYPQTNHCGESYSVPPCEENNSVTVYDRAAAFACKQLVKSALLAGSRNNITVMVVLLQGCDIETFENMAPAGH